MDNADSSRTGAPDGTVTVDSKFSAEKFADNAAKSTGEEACEFDRPEESYRSIFPEGFCPLVDLWLLSDVIGVSTPGSTLVVSESRGFLSSSYIPAFDKQ